MSRLPIQPNLKTYRGSKENLRRKNADHNLIAYRVADHINQLIFGNPSSMQQYIFAEIASDLDLTVEQVRSAISDGGFHGRTIGKITQRERNELAKYITTLKTRPGAW